MTSRKSILGVLCLSAFCLCAFGASSASATTAHECLKVALGTSTEYSDATCSTQQVGGGWRTTPISIPANLTLTQTSSSTLSATIGGIKLKFTCEKLSGGGKATNEEVGGEMRVHGSGYVMSLEGCKVEEPAGKGCKIPATITTEKMTSVTKDEAADVMKNTLTPEVGAKFFTLNISGCEGAFAVLNGAKEFSGSLTGLTTSANPTSMTFSATSSSIKFAGQSAQFITTTHQATTEEPTKTIAFETP